MTTSYHTPRPLIICLHGIGPNGDENGSNITPLEQWGQFNADVYSVPWFKGLPGKPSWGRCLFDLGVETKRLADIHHPSVIIYIGFSTGFLVGCKTIQYYRKNPSHLVRYADAIVSMYGVTDLTKPHDFMQDKLITAPWHPEPLNVLDLFNIFLTGTFDRDERKLIVASPANGVIDFPVLAFHGNEDTVVNRRQTFYLSSSEHWTVDGETHKFSLFKYNWVISEVQKFITAQHLGAVSG